MKNLFLTKEAKLVSFTTSDEIIVQMEDTQQVVWNFKGKKESYFYFEIPELKKLVAIAISDYMKTSNGDMFPYWELEGFCINFYELSGAEKIKAMALSKFLYKDWHFDFVTILNDLSFTCVFTLKETCEWAKTTFTEMMKSSNFAKVVKTQNGFKARLWGQSFFIKIQKIGKNMYKTESSCERFPKGTVLYMEDPTSAWTYIHNIEIPTTESLLK